MPSLSVPFHLSSTDNRNVLIFISKICFVFPFKEWEGEEWRWFETIVCFPVRCKFVYSAREPRQGMPIDAVWMATGSCCKEVITNVYSLACIG